MSGNHYRSLARLTSSASFSLTHPHQSTRQLIHRLAEHAVRRIIKWSAQRGRVCVFELSLLVKADIAAHKFKCRSCWCCRKQTRHRHITGSCSVNGPSVNARKHTHTHHITTGQYLPIRRMRMNAQNVLSRPGVVWWSQDSSEAGLIFRIALVEAQLRYNKERETEGERKRGKTEAKKMEMVRVCCCLVCLCMCEKRRKK